MIDIRKLKELVRLMAENDLTELELKDQAETVVVKRGVSGMAPAVQHAAAPSYPARSGGGAGAAEGAEGAEGAEAGGNDKKPGADDTAGLVPISSPMVGTFYTSANPDSPPFVSAGASVGPDTTVCLIEAMKVFNEIKAETSGTIERVLVETGKPVEYGQKMFMVRPA